MELGATVCVPNGAPLCEQCPWNSLCLARKEGRIAELPVRTKAKARRIEKRTVLVIRDNDKVAIRNDRKKDFWQDSMNCRMLRGDTRRMRLFIW